MPKFDTLTQAQADGRAPWDNVVVDTKDFIVYRDGFPVADGHLLVVPKVNNQSEVMKCFKYAMGMGNENVESGNDITGYNIGLNVGASAGQTCMYPHVHMIPRRDDDCEDPSGGVRHCVPNGKGNYFK
jgi:diadenosine tetraphosphate (Ap4A) HIT family hydrolase